MVRIHLRIPGLWTAPEELDEALAELDSPYRLEKGFLIRDDSGWRCECGASPHDDELAGLFAHEGRLSQEEVDAVADHTVKVHLTGAGGSVHNARAMMDAASAVVMAGASGVMVDNSGVCHGRNDWLKLAGDLDAGGVYWAHVAITREEDGTLFSIGMHCLGFRDADLRNPPDNDEQAWFVLNNFLGYSYRSGATINDGDVVGLETGPLPLRVNAAPCTRIPDPDSPFFNPYGVWVLEPLQEKSE